MKTKFNWNTHVYNKKRRKPAIYQILKWSLIIIGVSLVLPALPLYFINTDLI